MGLKFWKKGKSENIENVNAETGKKKKGRLKRFFTSKKFLYFLLILAVAAFIVWFFFIRTTPTGFANEKVDIMKEKIVEYEKYKKEGSQKAYEAAQEVYQAMYDGYNYRKQELVDAGKNDDLKEFDAIFVNEFEKCKSIVVEAGVVDEDELPQL